ncbi:rhomboid family intramembrane serine protease (plasmid) [Bacillus sp. 31A1R]|uniref:Rhomboid family intramembrane serine protease n=1 Tax=Robertmurraya mangrovi TaxID=3098077 RepID=A0ABU5IV24_9BACI|nr:rhomboid family intramembrane serine protease [Bacillus sp. 31A1R]MDZ5471000.1 rhomboid family intramembrane serine protease [Bacillus sp. 31A1R]
MKTQEDYLFWRLAHYFITKQEYRLIQLSKDENELWLEKIENKQAQVIRLLKYNLDWSNWLQRDIELTSQNGERIRKQLTRRELNILNLYITAFLPVDDYKFRIAQPFLNPNQNKTIIHSKLLDRQSYDEWIVSLEDLFDEPILIAKREEYLDEEIEQLKQSALNSAVNQIKREKSLFEYGKPFFTYIFIILQVAFFGLLELNGGSTNTSTLIKFGAKFNPLILEGEWWRFFTPVVLHIGILHLLMNTLALYYLGTVVERIYGNSRFLFIYLLAGFSGSLASFLFSPSLSAGASGAIFGCFGALLFFGLIYPKLFFRTMGFNILVVLAINLSLGFTIPGIDNAGHIGGLIGGFLATGIVHFPKKRKLLLQGLFLGLTALGVVGLLQYGYASAVVDEKSVLIMAQQYNELEEYEKGYSLLYAYTKENQDSAEVYFLLSYTEIKLEKLEDARAHLQKVIELNPDFHEAHYNLALVYLNENQLDLAKEHATKALDLRPNQNEYKELVGKINGQL